MFETRTYLRIALTNAATIECPFHNWSGIMDVMRSRLWCTEPWSLIIPDY